MILWNTTSIGKRGFTLTIQGQAIRPGKFIEVEFLGAQDQKLLGTCLHIGNTFPTPPPNYDVSPLSKEECAEALANKSTKELHNMWENITPPISHGQHAPSRFWLESKILYAIFSDSYVVSPRFFLWTNHWSKLGSTYIKKDI